MPISYELDQERRCLRTTATGQVTAEEILAHFHAVREVGALPCKELIDAREVRPPYLSSGELWSVAHVVLEFKSAPGAWAPRAVVVNGDLLFGMARVFASLVGGLMPVNVFRDLPQAEQWLAGLVDSGNQ